MVEVVFTDSELKTMVSAMFCDCVHLNFDVIFEGIFMV
jgi:hypothetical protein